MRAILAASLLLTPLFFPAAAVASKPATGVSATAVDQSISTGLAKPVILRRAAVILSPNLYATFPDYATVVLKLKVDHNGMVRNVRVVKSADQKIDKPVMEAVQQFSWRPARLDHQSIGNNVLLTVVVRR